MGNEPALFYEIFLANMSASGLQRVEVLDGARVLKTIEGDELSRSLREPQLGVGDYAVYMWVSLAPGDKPLSISHKLYFEGQQTALEGARSEISYAAPIVISPPVYGNGWLSAEGPYNFNHHRRAIIPLMGKEYVPERYAIDWIKYGPNGKIYKTDGATVEDYYAYGQEIHAVADGEIVDTKDGIPNNVPFDVPATSVGWAAGNLVTEQIGNGTYAYYVHMIPGSLRVKIGDKVKTGDVLGLLGSTGISGAPHLHFHLGDTKDPLFTNGLPYVFNSYEWDGNGDWEGQFNSTWNGSFASPVIVNMSMPGFENVLTLGPMQNSTLKLQTAFEGGVKYRTANDKFTVLDLHGSFHEMGRQYGYLMKNEMQVTYNRTMADLAAMGQSKALIKEAGDMLYESNSEKYVELMSGMSETSGLTLEQQKELNGGVISLIRAYIQKDVNTTAGCSGVAFWGNYSKDGKLYFGRNWDMINSLLSPYLPYMTVAVYHPDSGNTVANLEWIGEVYTETAMNDKGIFLELNNGAQSDPTHVDGRPFAPVKLLDFMFDSSDMADISREFNTTMDADSYIVQAADKNAAYSFEWPTFGVHQRSENVSGLLVAYNDFVPPYPASWEGRVSPPNPIDTRRANFLRMANSGEYRGKMDATLMQKFLELHARDGGGRLSGNLYQVIAVPEDYKMWLHGQNYSGWEEIDLAPLFFGHAGNAAPVKTGPAADEVTISIVPQSEARAALESGKMDYYLSPLAAGDAQAITSGPSNITLYPAISTIMTMVVNPAPAETGINPFSSQKARFALNFLVDREQVAREVYGGGAFGILTNLWPAHPSYKAIAPTVDSFNISYDKKKGMQLLGEAMAEEGIVMVNGTWSYNGTPIALILPIYNGTGANQDTQALAGVVANNLRGAGFMVKIAGYDSYDSLPQYSTNPASMKWNAQITGATYYSASEYEPVFAFTPDSQDGWWQYNNTGINAASGRMSNASTAAEWNAANNEIARLGINDSVGIWLVALDSNFGARKDVSGIVDDRFVGIRDYSTARQASANGKKTLTIGAPSLYDNGSSWNPVVVENLYMMDLLNAVHDPARTADPATLDEKPYRWNFTIERFSAPKHLPEGAFAWSADAKRWVAAPANATAMAKATYDLSRYIGTDWHNGQTIGWADVLYFLASTSDRIYDANKQKVSSEQYKGILDSIVGYRISGNTLETYMNAGAIDDSSLLGVARMFQRAAPFEIYAAGDSVVFAQKKYAYGDGPSSNLTTLSLINGSHIRDVLAAMGGMADAQIAPMVTANGVDYLENGMLASRLKADRMWDAAHGNLVISDGAFYLDYYNQTDGSARLKAFRDPLYPFANGAWLEK